MILSKFGLQKHFARLGVLIVLFSMAFAAACNRAETKEGGGQRNTNANARTQEVITVTLASASAREVATFIQATGSLVAQEQSDVAPKVAGKVTNTMVNVGDFVQQGTVLAKLDENEARNQLREAEAGAGTTRFECERQFSSQSNSRSARG
jgi:multidrug efflux pump subunit AcrA (membrane-fusion protein)